MEEVEEFVNHVESLGFTGLPLSSYYQSIKSNSVEALDIANYKKQFKDDTMTYDLKFRLDEPKEQVILAAFKATLRHIPFIEHGLYNGVDTKKLEQLLASVDWRKEKQLPPQQQLQQEIEAVADLFVLFNRLRISGNEQANLILSSLQFKYWSGTPIEDYVNLSAIRQQFEKTYLFSLDGSISDCSAKDAYNLLSGRHVVKFEETSPFLYNAHWTGLVPSHSKRDQLELVTHPKFEIAKLLGNLPLVEMRNDARTYELIYSLAQGDETKAALDINGLVTPVLLVADPASQKINLLDVNGKSLPASVLQPSLAVPLKKSKNRKPPIIKRKPGKNRGIS